MDGQHGLTAIDGVAALCPQHWCNRQVPGIPNTYPSMVMGLSNTYAECMHVALVFTSQKFTTLERGFISLTATHTLREKSLGSV
jgi:hypothetical protein